MITSVAMGSNTVLTGSMDGTAILHDLVFNLHLHTLGSLYNPPITAVTLSKDEHFAVIANTQAQLYDVSTGQLMKSFTGHNDLISSVAISTC